MMSFLGSIGYNANIMQGFGLQALFEFIYAEGSVNAMLNDKDIYPEQHVHIHLSTPSCMET